MTFLNFTVPDASPLINYSDGQWVEGSPTNDSFTEDYTNKSFKVTFDAFSTATFTFVGTSITIFGAKRPNHGNYSVSLDNGPAFVGNGNGNNIFQFPLWNAQNLSNEQHTALMTNVPTKQGEFLDIDFISIGRELGPPGFTGSISTVMLDDDSPFITYNPPSSWSPIPTSDAFNLSLHKTTDEGASISLSFQGSSIELYGLYVNAPFQVMLDRRPSVTLAGPNVDLNTTFEHPQTLLFLADGLDENKTHNVTLVNSVSNPDQPLYFDYAIIRSSQNLSDGTPRPSPDANFTTPVVSTISVTFTTPTTLSSSTSKSKTGDIVGGVVGGIAGLAIMGFIGVVLLRRLGYWKLSRSTSAERIDLLGSVISDTGSNALTPFVATTNTDPRSTNNATNQKSLSLPTSTPHSTSSSDGVPPSSPREGAVQVQDQQIPDTVGGSPNQSCGNNLMPQFFIMQGEDAGPLKYVMLPPSYNDTWQEAVAR
ncbi:hypothetical protein Clacol_000041 [Clathrus columnatus]|uniref:Transmembrane protein n=1 Tax=Clathrus columnatus TaxID=1419009 RepID=A0AAV4ZY55_9AGAM|nr:hypothetical protein Clacol_000041 [Clathrus columnatus]